MPSHVRYDFLHVKDDIWIVFMEREEFMQIVDKYTKNKLKYEIFPGIIANASNRNGIKVSLYI